MTNPGFVRLFSSPLMAFLISAVIVSACGYAIYRLGRDKPAPAARRYWKLLSFAAEICIAVGLIGLASFAGRMKIGADHQLLEERVRLSQAAVDERLRVAAAESCAPASTKPLTPYNPTVAKKDLCAISSSLTGANVSSADWASAEMSLRDFSGKYPGCVANVFTRHSECDDTLAAATQLADEIRMLESHKEAARNDGAMSSMLDAPSSWGLLLLAFMVAAIGVAIKCARATTEYLSARHSDN